MDEILDPFLPSSSWSEVNSPQRSSWVCATASQTSSILAEPYRKIEQNPTARVIPSGQMLGGLQFHEFDMHPHDESGSIFVADDLKYGINPCYFPIDNLPQQDVSNHISLESQHENQIPEKGYSLPGATESNPATGSFCVDHGSVGSNDNEPSVFPQSLEDSQSTSGVPPLWTSAYSSVPSLAMDHVNLQNFGRVHGEFLESEVDILGRRYNDGELQQDVFPRLLNEQKDLHNSEVLSVTPGSQMNLTGNNCMRSNSQLSQGGRGNSIQHYTSNTQITQAQPIPANTNSTPKPRRARRGQATDPHSIAERLRREKIAERMKNLQGLVPNSNKTDKASMLDEIIDYVKFLQLQVKVLSMSRVGAAGAVVPLITEIQADGTGGLLLSPSVDLEGTDPSESDDNIEFEREVVKLMESNVTTAMQYLQTKGLCLMPTALAAAISSRKGSSTTSIPPGKKKPDAPIQFISPNNEPMKKESDDRSELPKGCNGITIKQEDSQKSSSNVRDLKSKA